MIAILLNQQLALCCQLRENMNQMTTWTHRAAIFMSKLLDADQVLSSIQRMLLFFNELYRFLEFVCVYYSTILGFCAIISVFVLGIIMILRSTLFSKSIFGKGALWCLLIPVIFCGKLHAYFETYIGIRMFNWWCFLCSKRWISMIYFVGILIAGAWLFTKRKRLMDSVNHLYD